MNFTIGKFALTYNRNQYMSSSLSYYSSPLVLVVPPGNSLPPIEKLLGPFEPIIWYLVVTVILISFLCIKIVTLSDKSIQHFVFGRNVESPYMNVFSIFFGISMKKLPNRNFARTLFLLFTIYCFIVRNSYQGSLFRFLRTSFRGKEIEAIDDAVEKDFTFYMVASAQEHTIRIPEVFKRRFVLKSSEVPGIRMKTLDSGFQGTLVSSLEQILYINKINQKNYSLKVCPEYLSRFYYGIYFRKNSYLIHAVDNQILILLQNGLISYWARMYVDENYLKPKMETKAPQALQMDQISGVFEVFAGGLFLAILAFLAELVFFKCFRN